MKIVLITGCSSGIGEAAAKMPAANGWSVIATDYPASCGEHPQTRPVPMGF